MTDRDVYLRLAAMAAELQAAQAEAEGVVGGAALGSAAATLAGMARAIYEHCLADEVH